MKRRKFLQRSAFVTAGTMLVPEFIRAAQAYSDQYKGRRLVIIQFSGGNDGLNTVIPYRNDIYYRVRPQIAIKADQVLKLNDEMGLHPSLKSLQKLYDTGDLAIVNSVGYPNPDRSHFRSMDIWQTGSGSQEYLSNGWIGRYLDQADKQRKAWQAVEVDESLSLAMKGVERKALTVSDPRKLYNTTRGLSSNQFADLNHQHEHENLGYLYKTLAETINSAEYIYEQSKVYQTKVDYPNDAFAKDLKQIAQMINSGIETEIYYVSLNGFDTHAGQINRQSGLLKRYAAAMDAFVKDLKGQGNWDDTLVMTFSEFGRRVAQNASRGTDHGTANSVMLMGGKLKNAGFYNGAPDLSKLDKGDLIYQVDFRQIYSTILQNWLNTDPSTILSKSFAAMNII